MKNDPFSYTGMRSRNNRRSGRVGVSIEALYEYNQVKSRCLLNDLSETGASLKVSQFFTSGDLIIVHFTMPDKTELSINARVRHVKGSRIGIEFYAISDSQKTALNAFIKKESSKLLSNVARMKGLTLRSRKP